MNAKLIVQALKDSKAQVMFAFLFARQALDVKEIQSWTGLKRQTVYSVVESLEGMGLLAHQVVAHGRKVFLPAGDVLPLFQMSSLGTPGISATATDSLILNKEDSLTVVVADPQMSPKRTPAASRQKIEPDFSQYADLEYESYDASFEKNWRMCKSKGIGEPSRTKLSMMAHVMPGLIKAHVDDLCKGEGIGLAIRRIEGDELPRSWEEAAEQIAEELKKRDDL